MYIGLRLVKYCTHSCANVSIPPLLASGDLLLASCSQDLYIRVWRVVKAEKDQKSNDLLQLKGNKFQLLSVEYCVTLETVLLGHEDWVYSVQWRPQPTTGMFLV